jgi:murein DD-endopeptidase MepM/ murein hydrolase activator NlpD
MEAGAWSPRRREARGSARAATKRSAGAVARASTALLLAAVSAGAASGPLPGLAVPLDAGLVATRGPRLGDPAVAVVTAAPVRGSEPAAGAGSPQGAPRWLWPVAPPHAVTRPFEAPATAYGPGHRGIDIAATPGAEVHAPADGTVSFSGVVVDRPVVSIQHADGLVSSVEPVVPSVSAGEAVVAGQVIGTLADAPRHEPDGGLHLGARLHGEYVDPALLLAALRHAVLLPLGP